MKNENNIENFDSFFRENLNQAQVPAPEGIWQNISQGISPTPNPVTEIVNQSGNIFSSISTIGKVAIIAASGIVAGTAIYFATKTNQSPEYHIENTTESEFLSDTNIDNKEELTLEKEIYDEVQELPENPQKSQQSPKPVGVKPSSTGKGSKELNAITSPINDSQPSKLENDVPTKPSTSGQNNNPTSEPNQEKKNIKLVDTIICFTQNFSATNAFGFYKIGEIKINGNLVGKNTYWERNQWIEIQAKTSAGLTLERRVKLSSSKIELSISNQGEGIVYCLLENAHNFTNTLWYINNQLIQQDVNHIVYNRNMESVGTTNAELTLVTTDPNACADTAYASFEEHLVEVFGPEIPNIFTPNNDGLNDEWLIQISGEIHFNVKVIGANNMVMFQSSSSQESWNGNDMNGNPLPTGNYLYIIEYQFPGQKTKTSSGIIQLIRN